MVSMGRLGGTMGTQGTLTDLHKPEREEIAVSAPALALLQGHQAGVELLDRLDQGPITPA